jgi:twitching motility protein PilU
VDGKRVPAVEVLLNTKHIQDLIAKGEIDQIKDALEQSLSPGSQSFEQALFHHISTGKVSVDEAMAHSDSPTNLHWLLNNAPKPTAGGATTAAQAAAAAKKAPDDLTSIKLNLDALG